MGPSAQMPRLVFDGTLFLLVGGVTGVFNR
jgi:hypothetical protein